MHELGIVFHIIRTVEDVARQNDVTRIRRVTLQLGEVSGVVESYLQDCWKWAAAKSGAFARRGADRGGHPRRDRVRGLRPTVPHRAVLAAPAPTARARAPIFCRAMRC